MKKLLLLVGLLSCLGAYADVYLIDGQRVEGEVHEENGIRTICTDEMCIMIPDDAIKLEDGKAKPQEDAARGDTSLRDMSSPSAPEAVRLAQGYLKPPALLAFLRGGPAGDALDPFEDKSIWMILLIVLVGGFLMNLTPCVLPMVPINLMIIGKSASRGALYGFGIALAYGVMGVLAAVGGMAFGQIQGNPWFNAAIALVFLALGLSMLGVFFIDFSKKRGGFAQKKATMLPGLFAFSMGLVSAVLAGACVAPILIAVLLLTAKLYAEGTVLALGLPFVLGLGMALPWPFAGAGLQVLPKPGGWMKYVNKAFGILVLGFACWYGYLAWQGFGTAAPQHQDASTSQHLTATPETFPALLARLKDVDSAKPVFVDCWATWCKNCAAMEKTTFRDPTVIDALKDHTVIKLQAEDIKALKALPGFEGVKGLPAFLIFN